MPPRHAITLLDVSYAITLHTHDIAAYIDDGHYVYAEILRLITDAIAAITLAIMATIH